MSRITIISGFLGAGKTTFANLLLNHYIQKGETTAYIVNEFGQAGLDSALLQQKGFQTLDIVGGCICCTLRGRITDALREVLETYNPARIVFEPSGIFIFEKFLDVLEDPLLKGRCTVDGVITIVDSVHAKDALFVPGNFFTNQIAHADTLVLSKLQLFQGNPKTLIDRLHGFNERADILAKPWDELTDKDFATLDLGGSVGIDDEPCCCGHAHHDHHHDHDHHDHAHHHDDAHEHPHGHEPMDTVSLLPRPLDAEALAALEKALRAGAFGEVYRIKGPVRYDRRTMLLQAVFDTIRLEENSPEGVEGLTFIGHELDEEAIRKSWA